MQPQTGLSFKKNPAVSLRQEIFLFLLPFALWLCFRIKYFIGIWPWSGEATAPYHWAKFFLLALSHGEYPLWDPFHFWGYQDDYVILNYGQLNPFLYLALLLYKLGCPYMGAFLTYHIIYYGFGLLGIYCLAKAILQNTILAFWAYLLMLFSSLGIGWDMQSNIFLALAPIPWFFYFLIQLNRTEQKKYILGIIFTSTLIVTTYVPSYFIITFTSFIMACALFCLAQFKQAISRTWRVCLKHKQLVLIGILTLFFSLVPRLMWYSATQDPQYIFNVRSGSAPGKHAAAVDIKGANLSNITTEYTFPELFTDLDIGTTQFYYISIFVYLIVLLSLWNKATTILKILFFMFFFIFIYIVGDVMPLHGIAFYAIPLAKYARNYFVFGPILAGLLALFAMEHLKQLWDLGLTGKKQRMIWTGYLLLVHLVAFAYLLSEDFVSYSSYAAVLLSLCAFLIGWLWRKPYAQKMFLILLTAAMMIQPLEVNYHFARRDFSRPQEEKYYPRPAFSYTRPAKDERYLEWGWADMEKEMQDLSGYAGDYYLGVKWSYFLNQNVSHDTFAKYTQYKFYLFDNTVFTDDRSLDLKRLENSLSEHDNVAFIFPPASIKDTLKIPTAPPKAQIITADSAEFKILDFRLNSIRFMTAFDSPKFLVYNDSYHSSWRAFINGKASTLYRANVAFKGIRLPAGKNIVEFHYGPFWLPWLYTLIIVYFLIFSLYTLKAFVDSWRLKELCHPEKIE